VDKEKSSTDEKNELEHSLEHYEEEHIESHLSVDAGGHESDEVAWLTSYADMMTVLCCFFILLVSMAEFDAKKFGNQVEQVAKYFNPEKEVTAEAGKIKVEQGEAKIAKSQEGTGTLEGGSKVDEKKPDQMEQLVTLLSAALENNSLAKVSKENGTQIVFTGISMFEGGDAKLAPNVEQALDVMIDIIKTKGKDFSILVEGHTDDMPLQESGRFPSNWELSAARASYVLRKFEKSGFNSNNLVAVGYAHTRPAYPNVDGLGKAIAENQRLNRRVVIKIIPKDLKGDEKERLGLGIFFKNP